MKIFIKSLEAIITILAIALALLFFTNLVGCKSPEKAAAYLQKKGKLAEVCANAYPVKETIIYKPGDTVINEITTPGATITRTDTVVVNGETVYKTIYLQCPQSKVTTKTIHDTVFNTVENTARVAQLQGAVADKDKQIEQLTAECDKWETKARKWWFWILAGIALTIGIRVAVKLFA
jgi:hypothetical protein